MADVERERIGAVILLKNWLGDLAQDRGSVLEVSAYLSGALCDLAEGIARFNARRMALLCTEAEVAKRALSELRNSLREAIGASLAEEGLEKPDSFRGMAWPEVQGQIEEELARNGSPPGSPEASGERSDTTSPGEGGIEEGLDLHAVKKSQPIAGGSEQWRKDLAPEKEKPLTSWDIRTGVFRGINCNSSVVCRECGAKTRARLADRADWPEVDLCADCYDLSRRVRSGPIASAPWEGIPDDALVVCDGCGLKSKAGLERRSWPLPTLCRDCARQAEPEVRMVPNLQVTEEQHDAMLAQMRARGELIEEQPMVAIHLEGVRAIGSYVHRKLTEAGTEAGTKGGETNPNSRKRPRGAKNAQNFREKREERFRQVS